MVKVSFSGALFSRVDGLGEEKRRFVVERKILPVTGVGLRYVLWDIL